MIEVKNKEECVGCTACADICPRAAIHMMEDNEGFLYPEVDLEACIDCGICDGSCPMSNARGENRTPVSYAVKSRNEDVLKNSSSGGVFYHLAKKVLLQGGSIYGAASMENGSVQHVCIEKVSDIGLLMGSKYVQSKLDNIYLDIRNRLEEKQLVMFVGTPCQVEGLHTFLRKDYNSLIMVDFVCHGVASPKVLREYFASLENRFDKKIRAIRFRDKKISWKNFSFAVEFDDSTEWREEFKKNTYLRGFLDNLYLRPSCYQCRFKTINRISDITMADFWGIQYVKPEFDCDEGVSLCCVNSKNGQVLFDSIGDEVDYLTVDFEEAIRYNSAYTQSVKLNRMRRWFFDHLEKTPIENNISNSLSPNIVTRILLKVKSKKYGV
ncbi:MAG: Coenzyme F420 hydrogenase/dehydrogenase, beta subunit C-terminal domain [Lachnoclostridium sp.]